MSMRAVCGLSLLVHDYDTAIRFFCDTLALFRVEVDADFGNGNRFVDLSFADVRFAFAINLIRASEEDRTLVGRQAGRNLLFSLPISDPDSMIIWLKDQNIETEQGIIELPYGRQIILKDCMGNRISLFHGYQDNAS
jgi:hypothetical protein